MYKGLDGKYEAMVISIHMGVITMLDEYGNLVYYKQRGIARMGKANKEKLIQMGRLDPEIDLFRPLPSQYKLVWEDGSVMRKPEETFKA